MFNALLILNKMPTYLETLCLIYFMRDSSHRIIHLPEILHLCNESVISFSRLNERKIFLLWPEGFAHFPPLALRWEVQHLHGCRKDQKQSNVSGVFELQWGPCGWMVGLTVSLLSGCVGQLEQLVLESTGGHLSAPQLRLLLDGLQLQVGALMSRRSFQSRARRSTHLPSCTWLTLTLSVRSASCSRATCSSISFSRSWKSSSVLHQNLIESASLFHPPRESLLALCVSLCQSTRRRREDSYSPGMDLCTKETPGGKADSSAFCFSSFGEGLFWPAPPFFCPNLAAIRMNSELLKIFGETWECYQHKRRAEGIPKTQIDYVSAFKEIFQGKGLKRCTYIQSWALEENSANHSGIPNWTGQRTARLFSRMTPPSQGFSQWAESPGRKEQSGQSLTPRATQLINFRSSLEQTFSTWTNQQMVFFYLTNKGCNDLTNTAASHWRALFHSSSQRTVWSFHTSLILHHI